ncbi:MAG: hypothetical protein V4722_22280 [Bacteroidota bacterium]
MRKTIAFIVKMGMSIAATAQSNVGIGTNTPGSTLTVNGSMAAGYTAIIANTYTILADDYYIVWNQKTIPGPGVGIFTLPAAATLNKGRVYKIRNNSSTYAITLNSSGSVFIDNALSVNIPPNHTLEIIANGSTAVNTTCWEVVGLTPVLTLDGIRNVFAASGCASCGAYDAAGPDTWVQITNTEYNALLTMLNGAGTYFASPTQMGTSSNNTWSGGFTITENFFNQTVFPAGTYPIAMSIRTGALAAPTSMQGVKLKLSTTSQTSGYADIPASGAGTPNISGPAGNNTVYYFALKRPTQKSSAGGPSNIAVYTSVSSQLGVIAGLGGTCYYGSGDVPNPSAANTSTTCVQVVGTATKQW